MQLNLGEKESMEIFRYLKIASEQGIQESTFQANLDRYLSPPSIKRIDEILESLEGKGLIQVKDTDYGERFFILTDKGEQYLYGN